MRQVHFHQTLNRMVELVPSVKMTGSINYNGQNIFDPRYKVEQLRTDVGMVFQKPNPFPKSIYENIAYGPKIHGIKDKTIWTRLLKKV
jgi:phosphate transport system ATP-binding protein